MAISVLIVEDDNNIAELLQMYLEKEGYAVDHCARTAARECRNSGPSSRIWCCWT